MILDVLHAFPGWTWEYVERYITVPRVNMLVKYWAEQCPPASRSLAAWIGFKPKQSEAETNSDKDMEEFFALFPQPKR